jgi:hypothetical protein
VSNTSKPAWGSYADLKRIQRESERTERENAPAPPEQTGHPQTGHPNPTIPGTHEPGTQSPTDRAPGHPPLGARVPELRAPTSDETGHPGTHKPGTQKGALRELAPRPDGGKLASGEPIESPHWPSRKFKTRLNLRFPGDLAQQLDAYCRRTGLSKQDAAEIAIRQLLSTDRSANRAPGHPQTGHPQTGHPEQWVPESAHDHDDEDDDRIIIYQQMTGNRINARDRAAFAEIRHLHTDIIREGIRLSVERAPTPVKSLRYCLGAIFEVAGRAAGGQKRAPAPAEAAPVRSFDETVLLARAVVRQLRHDTPTLDEASLRASLTGWSADQAIPNSEAVIAAALAAEGYTP